MIWTGRRNGAKLSMRGTRVKDLNVNTEGRLAGRAAKPAKGAKLDIYWKQFKSVLIHKWYVFLAGRLTVVPLWRLVIHDWSKFTPTELFGYAGNAGGSTDKKRWSKSWLHHLHHNPHHPEHYILSWCGNPEFYDEISQKVAPFVRLLPMPEGFVREMLADMMATGYKVNGSWDISIWLNQNGPKIHFHDETVCFINKVMKEIGYALTDNCDWSWIARQPMGSS